MKIKKMDLIDKIAQQNVNADKKENNVYTVRSMIKDLTRWEQFLSVINKETEESKVL